MKTIAASRTIKAPLELVFETISDVRNFQNAVPGIVRIEFLTEQQTGVGTRFVETREMQGKEQSVELEVTELVENEHIRIVSDAGGTIWDSVFTVASQGDCVQLDLKMDVKPHTLMAKITTPLIMGFVSKGVEADMDSVKLHCESAE